MSIGGDNFESFVI